MARRITALHKAPLLGYYTMVRGGGVAVPWYLAGGVSAANCVAAYQPIGAASYAASLTDLSGTGNNAEEGTAPDWDVTNGWKFNGTSHYLIAPIIPFLPYQYSIIVRFSNAVTGTTCCLCGTTDSGIREQLALYSSASGLVKKYALGNVIAAGSSEAASGVMAISNNHGYYNGLEDCDISNGEAAEAINRFLIGARSTSINNAEFLGAKYIQAMAIYNTTLTADQVAAITTAMAALTSESKSQSLEGLLSFEPEEEKLWWQGADVQAVEEEKPQTFWQKAKKFIDDKLYQLWQAIEDYFDYHEED